MRFISDGEVTLNVEGKRYTASFHVGWGVMTVKLGSISKTISVHGPMVSPESAARTILRTMVREDPTLGHQQVAANIEAKRVARLVRFG